MNTTINSAVPSSAVLSAWQAHPWRDGIAIDQLSPLDRVVVKTWHSTYEIVVTAAGSSEILVRGGQFFPIFTAARLAGSSLGGSFLKLRAIHVGFRIEFAVDKRVIVTSPARSIAIASARTAQVV
jgi:hypothetical protein